MVAPGPRVGLSSVALGAGRSRADDEVDPAVGIVLHKKPGDPVKRGDTLAELHAKDGRAIEPIARRVQSAYTIGSRPPRPRRLVLTSVRR